MADFYPLCSVFQASLDIVEWLVTPPLKSLAQIYRIALGKSGHRSTSKHAEPDKLVSCRAYGLLYRQSWLTFYAGRGAVIAATDECDD